MAIALHYAIYMQTEISLIFPSIISYAYKLPILMMYATTETFPLIHNTVYYLEWKTNIYPEMFSRLNLFNPVHDKFID